MNTSPFKTIPEDSRATTFPIARKELWELYEKAKSSYWHASDFNMDTDIIHFQYKLNDGERHMIKYILIFFAFGDAIVNENLASRFTCEVPFFEAKYFYDFQTAIENLHAEVYSSQIIALVPDEKERNTMLEISKMDESIRGMVDYIKLCVSSDAPFAERLLRMACVEGLLFQGCFCIIYWFKFRGLMPGLCESNELISRDENLHTIFAFVLYQMIDDEHKLSESRIHNIFNEAVTVASKFTAGALKLPQERMNKDLMTQYLQYHSNSMLIQLNQNILYPNTLNPFAFMEQINMITMTNYFERKVTEYQGPTSSSEPGAVNFDF